MHSLIDYERLPRDLQQRSSPIPRWIPSRDEGFFRYADRGEYAYHRRGIREKCGYRIIQRGIIGRATSVDGGAEWPKNYKYSHDRRRLQPKYNCRRLRTVYHERKRTFPKLKRRARETWAKAGWATPESSTMMRRFREVLRDCLESAGLSVETLGSAEEFPASEASRRAGGLRSETPPPRFFPNPPGARNCRAW